MSTLRRVNKASTNQHGNYDPRIADEDLKGVNTNMAQALQPVDPSTIPQLSGRFEPISTEIEADELSVEGSLPLDLAGAYFRNGPDPKFTPLGSYTYPLEGDGMIHGLWIENGQARYANRWVHTNGMAAEERAGRALYGGLMTPAFVDMELLGPNPDPGWPFRLDPFINLVRHAGRYLALGEGTPPYEVTAELETVGLFDFAGSLPSGLCAHPKIDPVSGEMIVFRYDVEQPFLTWAVIGHDGTVTRPPTPVEGVDSGFMIHDFAITERYLVLTIGPAVLDLDAMLTGGAVLQWRPELGTRIAVIPRDASTGPEWIHTDAYWVWHFANAYEASSPATVGAGTDDLRIVLDFPWWSSLGLGLGGTKEEVHGALTRATLDPGRGSLNLEHLDGMGTEFPRIDDRLTGRQHRYLIVTAASGRAGLVRGEHDRLIRYDMATGTSEGFDCDAVIGEVIFAPRPGGSDELDGYYLTFASSLGADRRAWVYVWDASQFPSPPMAKVRIPQRVPNGLHGNWIPADSH
jgi:carotenoid cleavage dioxygenase-like enzyme